MSYMKKINPSNTTLSYNRKNTKYDIEQAKRHNHGKAYCDICNEMFTKTSWNAKRCSDKCKRAYKKEWLIVEIESSEGITIEAEIVKVTCPVCGEEHIGTKRASGGFIAGHQAYHEFVNATDMIMSTMGGQ